MNKRFRELLQERYRDGDCPELLFHHWCSYRYYAIAFGELLAGLDILPTVILPASDLDTFEDLIRRYRHAGFPAADPVRGFWLIEKDRVSDIMGTVDCDQPVELTIERLKEEFSAAAYRTATRPH